MAFLAPIFLVGAVAAAIPIVLHLLKREPEVHVKWSAVKLLRAAPVEHAQKRYLRELLLLALRVTALLLLAFAFARPFLTSNVSASASGLTVVAVDTSLSMSAPGQFEKAQRLAHQAIDKARGGATSVITFADTATVVSQPSGDTGLARAAVDHARPGLSSTSYRNALNAAANLLRGHHGTIGRHRPSSERMDVGDHGRCRHRSPSRLQMSVRRQKISRSPPPASWTTASWRLCATQDRRHVRPTWC
jgi:hypothetical protein